MPDATAQPPTVPPAAAQHIRLALVIGTLSLFVGGVIFQASSLAFDYMKLRDLPLYGSASSLPRFSRELELVARELEPQATQIRRLLRDRATIDIDVGEKAAEAAAAVSEGQAALSSRLQSWVKAASTER